MNRREILRRMEQVMGPCPALSHNPPPLQIDSRQTIGEIQCTKLRLEVEPGDWLPALLLSPPGKSTVRRPAVLCLHQTTRMGKEEPAGLGGNSNLHYGLELARRGFLTLCPDYPNFGEYNCDPYSKGYASATMKGIYNHRRALQWLAHSPGVDPHRLFACGHSLGGHNALFLAAFAPQVRAVITSCGFTRFRHYMHGDLTGWSHKGYMPRIATLYNKQASQMPFEFEHVLSAIAPRPIFVNAPLNDSNFDNRGVREAIAASHHPRITAVSPPSGHDFPTAERLQAYDWLQKIAAF